MSGVAGGSPAAARAGGDRGSVITTIAALTARSLLGRRRSLLLVLLALLPVAIAFLVQLSGRAGIGGEEVATAIMDRLLVTTLLPIVGAGVRDGRPRRRARGRDRGLPPGQADRPLADRGRPS